MVLLSKIDTARDSEGSKIKVSEGTKVSIFEFNEDDDEVKEYLLAYGIAELNKLGNFLFKLATGISKLC